MRGEDDQISLSLRPTPDFGDEVFRLGHAGAVRGHLEPEDDVGSAAEQRPEAVGVVRRHGRGRDPVRAVRIDEQTRVRVLRHVGRIRSDDDRDGPVDRSPVRALVSDPPYVLVTREGRIEEDDFPEHLHENRRVLETGGNSNRFILDVSSARAPRSLGRGGAAQSVRRALSRRFLPVLGC